MNINWKIQVFVPADHSLHDFELIVIGKYRYKYQELKLIGHSESAVQQTRHICIFITHKTQVKRGKVRLLHLHGAPIKLS